MAERLRQHAAISDRDTSVVRSSPSADRFLPHRDLDHDRLTREGVDVAEILEQKLDELFDRLLRIESAVSTLVDQRMVKEWYTTDEVAALLGRRPFTVREWCRLGRIHAAKRDTGRGNTLEWSVSHDELDRIRNHGLLPAPSYRHVR